MPESQPLGAAGKFGFMFGKWIYVDSSNVAEIRYDQHAKILYVGFDGGDPSREISYYAYPGIQWMFAWDLAIAPSKGAWVWDNLRGRVPGVHMRPFYPCTRDGEFKQPPRRPSPRKKRR